MNIFTLRKIDESQLKMHSISREMSEKMKKTENSRETVRLNRVFPGKSCEQISVKTDTTDREPKAQWVICYIF